MYMKFPLSKLYLHQTLEVEMDNPLAVVAIKKPLLTQWLEVLSCRGRIRTSTGQLAPAHKKLSGQPHAGLAASIMPGLSCDPHPRDKRACLPVSSLYIVERTSANLSIILFCCKFFNVFFDIIDFI